MRSESPSRANEKRSLPSSSFSTARSVFLSAPSTLALCFLPSSVMTSMSVALSTTWALVSAMPEGSTITPDPRLRWGMRSGASPKNRRKNSSPKNSSNGVRPCMLPPPPLVRDTVLMLMTAGLISSATFAKVPVVRGIWTGSTGASGIGGAWATTTGRFSSARPRVKAPSPAPRSTATARATAKVLRLSCIMPMSPPSRPPARAAGDHPPGSPCA
jgi:hypothetical protein